MKRDGDSGDTGAESESRRALQEFLATIAEIDSSTDAVGDPDDAEAVAESHRRLMHLIGAGLDMFFESSGEHPVFRRAHWSGRKFWGDNADCIYYVAQIDPSRTYLIRGNLAGAAYTSFTVDGGGIDVRYPPARVVSSLHDGQFTCDAKGNYEIVVSSEPPPATRSANWLRLEPDAAAIATRHYYEQATPIAADPLAHVPLTIELVGAAPIEPPLEQSVARDIRRLSTFIRGLTIGRSQPPAAHAGAPRPVITPNQFNPPTGWSADRGYGAVDIVNMMTRYELSPDEALVIDGRFPRCRFASVALWNRYQQTLDYTRHQVSLNRSQTELRLDGSFSIVVAQRDPGVVNWIETTGVNTGTVFVRYILPEDEPEPLRTAVVPVSSLRPPTDHQP